MDLLFLWTNGCWQFDTWFFCLFWFQLVYLKLLVHVLLKPCLKKFEHYFARMWNELNCMIVSKFFGIGMKTDLFQSCGHCWVFQICWNIECNSFTGSCFRTWNISVGILPPPLSLFIVMLPKSHLTLHSMMSGSRSVITPSWWSGSFRSFLYSSSVKKFSTSC